MIKKPTINKVSLVLLGQRVRRFLIKLPHDILLKYYVWIEFSIILIGAIIAIFLLVSFIFGFSDSGATEKEEYVSTINVSTDTIDKVNEWIEAREKDAVSTDSVLHRSIFN